MLRRTFLKSLGAIGAILAVPVVALAKRPGASAREESRQVKGAINSITVNGRKFSVSPDEEVRTLDGWTNPHSPKTCLVRYGNGTSQEVTHEDLGHWEQEVHNVERNS